MKASEIRDLFEDSVAIHQMHTDALRELSDRVSRLESAFALYQECQTGGLDLVEPHLLAHPQEPEPHGGVHQRKSRTIVVRSQDHPQHNTQGEQG